ncbi:MAG: class I SAM-dependent DNA methyltransferase [Anaerolineales bacterium]|nr:class I SAM-dependent DNA methyltransferase [Anaerolineales bacterium]
MNNFPEKVNFLWSIAELLRDAFKRSKYQDVILPFTVLRRIDCVLELTKNEVLETHNRYKGQLDNLDGILRKASGFAFYNTSPFTFERLLADPHNLAANLNAYINAFSDNMREVLEKFDFRNTIAKMDEAGLLFLVMEKFKNIDLHPDKISNMEMGYIFEELIRKFNEALNENPGEHFTPREVIRLMVNLLLAQDADALSQNHIVRTVYDPCCGSGGMLTIAEQRILEINPRAEVYLFGQEINPETFAVCKSDLCMKSADGRDAENIIFGSTLSNDQHAGRRFDYQLSNPPYGKEWKMDQAAVEAEAAKGKSGRFGAGLPRISDGQLLFLQHMLNRMNPCAAPTRQDKGGGRVAIVMNGSPLFTGDAGSGESEIRRWILENDWLEAIVALPEQLFYNTGIATYVWVLTNRKSEARKGKVQLIDATSFWAPMRKSLGDKRREISSDDIQHITRIFMDFREGKPSRIFDTTDFSCRKITVERPLRLNFQASQERMSRLQEQNAFKALAQSKKKDAAVQAKEIDMLKEVTED